MTDYNKMNLPEIKEMVKNLGIKKTSGMGKAELVSLLEDFDRMKELQRQKAEADKQKITVEKNDLEQSDSEKIVSDNKNAAVRKSSGIREKVARRFSSSQSLNDRKDKINDNRKKEINKKEDKSAEVSADLSNEIKLEAENADVMNAEADESKSGYNDAVNNARNYEERNNREENNKEKNSEKKNREEVKMDGRRLEEVKSLHIVQPYDVYSQEDIDNLDSGVTKIGIFEMVPESGYGFIRCSNFLPGENDVYVSNNQIRKLNLRTGDMIEGHIKKRNELKEKFSALLYATKINGKDPIEAMRRSYRFEDLTPIFPCERIHLETPNCPISMRMMDLISPIGKGQRGMIVSQPKTGKTTLLKQIAHSITTNHKEMHLIVLLIDERPEEVTDMKEAIEGPNVEVIYSTFDELPENHKRVSEMVIERAKRLVELKKDVIILLDSITRLARAYNLTCTTSGRTLSGGLDPAALHMPKRFFGAARNMREGGSLTILATALVETGSRMDDVVFEEFKGTGNMELVLNRNLSERRVFPAIDMLKSSTRREDLLLNDEEQTAVNKLRKSMGGTKAEEATEQIIQLFTNTKSNSEFCRMVMKKLS
ncbi:MAG: transcription termination factor Rho [Lachnospiraceae bacterium]|nr:transcription termination factor Rho [Lachnospiraceae bacterium]